MRTSRSFLLAMLASGLLATQLLAQAPRQPAAPRSQSPAPRRPAGPPPVLVDPRPEPAYDVGPLPEEYFDACPNCRHEECCCDHHGCLAVGYAFVLVQPHFADDVAFTSTTDDGTSLSTTNDTNFDYDLHLANRVWLEWCRTGNLGLRVTYWQFGHSAPERLGSPSDSGFDTIAPPDVFGGVDLAARLAGDELRVGADLDVDLIDLEGTKWTDFCSWQFGTTAGLRFASLEQGYSAQLRNANEALLGDLQAHHRFEGIGPTFSLEARRGCGCLTWFSMARGSLLFGDGTGGFTAREFLETPTPFTTVVHSERNDVMPVGELQIGLEWCRQYCNGGRFFCRTAIEGQVWQGAGNAVEEEGNLGFFGFHIALGMTL